MTHFPDRALYAAIPNALSAFLTTYEHCSARSGRTTATVHHLRDGDAVIFHDQREAMRVGRLALDAGKHIKCVVVAVDKFNPGVEVARGNRVLFDHGWVTAYWEHVLQKGSEQFWKVHELYNPSPQEVAGTPKAY